MSTNLGTAHGNVTINAAQALATLAALRKANAGTVGALNTTGRAAITAGTGLVAMGGLIAAGFATAVRKSAELEKELSYIGGITNVNEEQMEKLRRKVIQLGQDSAYTAQEVALGFTELAKAGATTEQMVGGMGDAMITLGQAADIPLDKAATALISISSTFNLAADQTARIADVMSGAANASIISVADMAISFKYAGGVAANLGASLEDTATAIAVLGQAGIRGSTAGTALRRIFLQLTPRTDAAAAAMENLGIITKDGTNRFYDASGRVKDLAEVTEILRTATAKLTPEMRQKAFATIFGDRAINAAIALSKGGAKAFKDMKAVIGDTTAEEIAKKRLDNLAGAWEIFKGTVDSALINAGSPAQKPLQQLVQILTKIVNIFNSMPKGVQKLIVQFLLIASAVFLLAGGFLLFFGTILRAVAVWKQLTDAFRAFTGTGSLVSKVMTKINFAFLSSPIFWIIAAVVALAVGFYLLYKRSETFRRGLKVIGETLSNVFGAIVDWFKSLPGLVSKAWDAVWGFLKNMASKVKDAVVGAFQAVVDWFKRNWDLLLPFFFGPFGLMVVVVKRFGKQIVHGLVVAKNAAIKAIKALVKGVAKGIAALPYAIGFAIGWVVGRVIRFGYEMLKWGITAGWNLVTGIFKFLVSLPGRLLNLFATIIVNVMEWAMRFSEWAWQAGSRFVGWLIGFIGSLPGRFVGWMGSIISTVSGWASSLISGGARAGSGFLSAVVDWVQQLPGRLMGFLATIIVNVVEWGIRIKDKAWEIGSNIVSGLMGWVGKLPGLVRDALMGVLRSLGNLVQSAWKKAQEFASGLWNGFKSGLGINSPSYIERALFDIEVAGEDSMNSLARQVKTLQRLSTGIPGSIGPRAGAQADWEAKGAARRASSQAAGSVTSNVEVKIINPKKERATTSIHREMQKLAYHGIVPDYRSAG